jgi:hypothetical protein
LETNKIGAARSIGRGVNVFVGKGVRVGAGVDVAAGEAVSVIASVGTDVVSDVFPAQAASQRNIRMKRDDRYMEVCIFE